MYNIFDIAGQGMSAQSVRLNTTASNMANAESASNSADKAYRARQPVFQAIAQDMSTQMAFDESAGSKAGVQVAGIVESQAPIRTQYQPDHPMADENGYIYLPNVNVIQEMANMISASRSYQNNVEMLNTAKQLLQRTLSLGQ